MDNCKWGPSSRFVLVSQSLPSIPISCFAGVDNFTSSLACLLTPHLAIRILPGPPPWCCWVKGDSSFKVILHLKIFFWTISWTVVDKSPPSSCSQSWAPPPPPYQPQAAPGYRIVGYYPNWYDAFLCHYTWGRHMLTI